MLAALAVTAAPIFGAPDTHAGPLAQLQLQSRTLRDAPRANNSCVGMLRTPHCRAALDTALHAAAQAVAFRARPQPAAHEFLSATRLSAASESRESLSLKFNTDPEWKKRAKVLAREGLTFLRLPEGGNRELTVGINRHGMLGFSLQDTSGE